MQKLETGKIEINSQFEANRVGRLAVFGSEDTGLQVRHTGYDTTATSESDFISRDYENGPLILGIGRSRAVEAAIGHIITEQSPYNSVTIEQAQALSRALENPVEEHDALSMSEEQLQKHIASIALYREAEVSTLTLELRAAEEFDTSVLQDKRPTANAA